MARKAAEAFRTISEVADELDVQKHVLRFWELKFPQLKPMKRGGGRRFYRPEDVHLLYAIRQLLHGDGFTIRGVQQILREQSLDQIKAAGQRLLQGEKAAETATATAAPAVKRKAIARARSQSAAEMLAPSPSSPLAVSGSATPMIRDAVELAIRELEISRKILTGEATVQGQTAARNTPDEAQVGQAR